MRKGLYSWFLALLLGCFSSHAQQNKPLMISIESIDSSQQLPAAMLKKVLKSSSQPIFGSDCTPEQQTFNRTVVAYGRTVVASKIFEELLRKKMREAYGKCNGDPFYDSDLETQIRQVLAACRAPRSIKINCTGGSGNASAGISNYDLNKIPEFSWGGWFQGVSQCAIQNNCTWAPFPWPYTQAAGTVWHELMHQYGYVHGANSPDENPQAKIACGIPASNTSWHFQNNTVPYIVGNCISEVLDLSQRACGDIRSCTSPNQIKLLDRLGGTTCSCVNDPGKKGLGILELNNGKLTDLAMWGDQDWIGGWNYNSADNKIVGTGDFNGDGNRDFILFSNWGIGIVTYIKPHWRALVVKPNGTWFGGWNFNSTQNKVIGSGDFDANGKDDILIQSDWGLGILSFDGSSSLQSTMSQARNTWFGSWRWDATVNTGRDKIQAIGDFNNDRKADILVTSSWGIGILTLAGNSMNAYVAKPNGTWFGGWNFSSRDNSFPGVGDLNGDGKTDIVLQSGWGLGVFSFDNAGSLSALMSHPRDTWFGSWRWDASVNAGRDRIRAIADFNNDRKADILVSSSWGLGILTLAGSSMNAYVAKPNGTWFGGWNFSSADNWFPGVADLNGDNKKDILIQSSWGIGVLALNAAGNNLMGLDAQPNRAFLGSWVMESTDNFAGAGNFSNATAKEELLFKKN